MDTTIFNISFPAALYADVKKYAKRRRYASVSEVIRDAVREWIYPRITVNGFTPEFESTVLKSEKEPIKNDVVLTSEKEIHDFFLHLKRPQKAKKRIA